MKNCVKKFWGALPVLAALLLVAPLASAQLGMTAGLLDFGVLKPGEAKNLSFGVFFAENASINFTAYSPFPFVSVTPANGTLEPGKIVWISVTVRMPANWSGTWQDFVRVRTAAPTGAGVANIQLEVAKKIIFASQGAVPVVTVGIPLSAPPAATAVHPAQPRGAAQGPGFDWSWGALVLVLAAIGFFIAFMWSRHATREDARRAEEALERARREADARFYALLKELAEYLPRELREYGEMGRKALRRVRKARKRSAKREARKDRKGKGRKG